MSILMGIKNLEQTEIFEPFQAKTDDGLCLKIHDKAVRAEKADKEIDIRLLERRKKSYALLVGFLDCFLGRADGDEAFQAAVMFFFNRPHPLLQAQRIDERKMRKEAL
jgi:hypothetical protein